MSSDGWMVDITRCTCPCRYFIKFRMCAHVLVGRTAMKIPAPGDKGKLKGYHSRHPRHAAMKEALASDPPVYSWSRVRSKTNMSEPTHTTGGMSSASASAHLPAVTFNQERRPEPQHTRDHDQFDRFHQPAQMALMTEEFSFNEHAVGVWQHPSGWLPQQHTNAWLPHRVQLPSMRG